MSFGTGVNPVGLASEMAAVIRRGDSPSNP